MRFVLSMEDVELLETVPTRSTIGPRGVDSVGLTWNHPNEFAGGIGTPTKGCRRAGARSSGASANCA